MNKPFSFLYIHVVIILCSFTGCINGERCPHKTEIEILKEQLTECQSLSTENTDEGFQHLVYFDLKDDLTPETILKFEHLLSTLSEVPGVENLKFGKFKELGDQRAMSSYEYQLSMTFANSSDYSQYQIDPLHQSIQKKASVFLVGPPSTYDYQ